MSASDITISCLVCLAAVLAGMASARAGDELLDPTRPASALVSSAQRSDGIRVEAVILRSGVPVAIVNGHVVRAGDRLGDILIEAVQTGGVRYSRHGHSAFAPLATPTVAVRHPPQRSDRPP